MASSLDRERELKKHASTNQGPVRMLTAHTHDSNELQMNVVLIELFAQSKKLIVRSVKTQRELLTQSDRAKSFH